MRLLAPDRFGRFVGELKLVNTTED